MFASRWTTGFVLAAVLHQCVAQTAHRDLEAPKEKRLVNLASCNKLIESQDIQLVPIDELKKREVEDDPDMLLEVRSDLTDVVDHSVMAPGMLLSTHDLQKKMMDKRGSSAAPFLGYDGGVYNGHKVLGGTNSSNSLLFEFYECDYSDFMRYKSYVGDDGTKYHYGIVKVAESGLCLQAAKLGERNQELVEDECSASDDSKQFLSFFEYRSRVIEAPNDPSMKTTVRSFRFLGKTKDGEEEDFRCNYKILYREDDQKVSIDCQKDGSEGAHGQEYALIMPQKRVGR